MVGAVEESDSPTVCEYSKPKVTKSDDEVKIFENVSPKNDNEIKVPERQRKAASLQYHLPTEKYDLLNTSSAPPRVVSCNLELLQNSNQDAENLSSLPTKDGLTTTCYNNSQKPAPSFNDSKWEKVKKVLLPSGAGNSQNESDSLFPSKKEVEPSHANAINSFSVPTSPTELSSPNLFYNEHGLSLYSGNGQENWFCKNI